MTLTVVWSVQARNQFVAMLTCIAKEDPLTAELVHERVHKSPKLLCDSPDMGVQAPTAGVRTYAVPKTGHSFDYRLLRESGFNAGTGNGKGLDDAGYVGEFAECPSSASPAVLVNQRGRSFTAN